MSQEIYEERVRSLEALVDEEEHASDRRRRRWLQGLSTVALISSGARELYRREVLASLPTARYVLRSENHEWRTTLHPEHATVPNDVSEVSSHAATLALSSVGGARRAQEHPWLSLAAAGLAAFHAYNSGRQLFDELERGEMDAFSAVNAIVGAASVPLTLPEAARAIKRLMNR
ncbi:MAG: hypothetical protein ACQEVA_13980 [Myxococcota bacterium]